MKYSRNRINAAGQILSSETSDLLRYAEAITVVEDWRKTHLHPLGLLVKEVSTVLQANGVVPAFSSRRLKRMTSIVEKLKHNPGMGLGGVQDIGGARFVFEDIESLLKAQSVIETASLNGFVKVRDTYDYVQRPKPSGYRSIHFVYKYQSEDPEYDGLSVELQIRTKLQHDWATAVETAELISKSPLKASLGDENWLAFFKLVSAIFARKEQMPVGEMYRNVTEEEMCSQYATMNEDFKFLIKLRGLMSSVEFTSQAFDGGFALLLIQYDPNRVKFSHFNDNELEKANAMYAQIENSLSKDEGAVVLVSVSDMKELQEAYPSYFLNAKEFVLALEEFNNTCKLKGYKSI